MRYIIVSLLILVAMVHTVCAQVLSPDIAEIKKTGQLVVAMTSFDNLPFYGGTPDNMRGLDVENIQKSCCHFGCKTCYTS